MGEEPGDEEEEKEAGEEEEEDTGSQGLEPGAPEQPVCLKCPRTGGP